MKQPFIPYGHQWVDGQDIKAVTKVLRSDWLTQGKTVLEFEAAVADYCHATYAVAFSSGTAALHAAYLAAGIKKGDRVVTTPLTFAATSNMAAVLGAKPVFVDIDPVTLAIDPKKVPAAITKKTKAIVAVDFAGHPVDYRALSVIAKKHKLVFISDACHALGAEYKGKKVGSFADMTVLSFHPVKHITTGEGGMVVTNSKALYEKLKLIRNHGMVKKPADGAWYYEVAEPYFNYRLTDIQCALGLSQLKKLPMFLKKRRAIVATYNKQLANLPGVRLPTEKSYAKSAWHIYPVQVSAKKRRSIFEYLQSRGIGVQVHYMPLHLHPFYKKKYGYKIGDFPVAEAYYQGAITLPLYPSLRNSDFQRVVHEFKKAVSK